MSLSMDYDLLAGHFDLSSEIKQEAPPYLPQDPPGYKLKSRVPQKHRPHAFDGDGGLSPPAGPDSARLSGFELAESIWSRDSDLTLDDLALDSDSASNKSRSSSSSHWSAPPLTPPTSRHLELRPALEPAPPEPTLLSVEVPVQGSELEPEEPDSPAPAYSRDPSEFDPALLASLDSQLRLRPFEAFEDVFWASFPDSALSEVAQSLPPRSSSLARSHPSTSFTSLTVQSTISDTSMATVLPPPLPPFSSSPPAPPPAYPTAKPLPSLPPPSPSRPSAEHTEPGLPEDIPLKPSVLVIENTPHPAAPSGETVHYFPLRPQVRPRSKSVGGTKTVQRLTSAIARLRRRD